MPRGLAGDELVLPDLAYKDFVKAVKGARPTVNAADNQKHIQFTEEFEVRGDEEMVYYMRCIGHVGSVRDS